MGQQNIVRIQEEVAKKGRGYKELENNGERKSMSHREELLKDAKTHKINRLSNNIT